MFRSLLFSIIFFSGIIVISIIFLPSLVLPQSFVLKGGKLMGYWTGFCLKTILSVNVEVLGKENIVSNKNFLLLLLINQCLKLFTFKLFSTILFSF